MGDSGLSFFRFSLPLPLKRKVGGVAYELNDVWSDVAGEIYFAHIPAFLICVV